MCFRQQGAEQSIVLCHLSRTSAETVQYTSAHKATICRRLGPPDRAGQTNDSRRKIDRTSAEGCAERDPVDKSESISKEAAKTEDKTHNSKRGQI